MSVVLLILGVVAAAAGTATIGFGITINEFTLGTACIIAGTTGLTGGLILIGLSAVVAELGRVGEALRARGGARPIARAPAEVAEPALPAAPVIAAAPPAAAAGARPPQQANVPVPPRPRPEAPVARPAESYPPPPGPGPSAVEVSAAAIERLRSSIPRTERMRTEAPAVADHEEVPLSPNGAGHRLAQPSRPSNVEAAPSELRGGADERIGAAPSEALKASRLDFLFRSKAARPAPQSENFETFWPGDARPGRSAGAEPQPRSDENQRYADYAPSVQAPPPVQAPPVQAAPVQASPGYDRRGEPAPAETAAILKSGVVDGMAYTLYSDGSIEARLPHGTVRFGSIGELRAHIESNS